MFHYLQAIFIQPCFEKASEVKKEHLFHYALKYKVVFTIYLVQLYRNKAKRVALLLLRDNFLVLHCYC